MENRIVSFGPACWAKEWWFSREPLLDENASNTQGKPTLLTRGVCHGYSMPVGGAGEELHYRMRVPFRWDGITNPYFVAITSPVAAEDVGDKYKFQLAWCSGDIESVIPDAAIETVTSEVTVVDGTAFYANIISLEFDATTLVSGQCMQGVLTRVASAEPAITGEVAIWHWDCRWKADKIGRVTPMGYDA